MLFTFLIPFCYIHNKRNKMPSTQLVYFIFLMRKHVSTSKSHLQASKLNYNCIDFLLYILDHWPED